MFIKYFEILYMLNLVLAKEKPFFRIVNGEPAIKGEVPYQISFKDRINKANTFRSFCGGSLTTESIILSAAHCFAKNGPNGKISEIESFTNKYAVAGNLMTETFLPITDSLAEGQWRRLSKVVIPLDFEFPKSDIAVVHVVYPFTFNMFVQPIPYAKSIETFNFKKCQISGFGKIYPPLKSDIENKNSVSPVLLKATVVIGDQINCDSSKTRSKASIICAPHYNSEVSKGDSGGPLVCKGTGDPEETNMGILVGVTSGFDEEKGTFFTRTSAFQHLFSEGSSNLVLSLDDRTTSIGNRSADRDFGFWLMLKTLVLYFGVLL